VLARSTFRFAVTLLAITAWLGVSNHCALGALSPVAKTPAVHAHCPGHSAPAKQRKGEEMPCCKTLKAITSAKVSPTANVLDFTLKDFLSVVILKDVSQGHTLVLERETGPPGALSFSESVLQRSILAHAPPSSLS